MSKSVITAREHEEVLARERQKGERGEHLRHVEVAQPDGSKTFEPSNTGRTWAEELKDANRAAGERRKEGQDHLRRAERAEAALDVSVSLEEGLRKLIDAERGHAELVEQEAIRVGVEGNEEGEKEARLIARMRRNFADALAATLNQPVPGDGSSGSEVREQLDLLVRAAAPIQSDVEADEEEHDTFSEVFQDSCRLLARLQVEDEDAASTQQAVQGNGEGSGVEAQPEIAELASVLEKARGGSQFKHDVRVVYVRMLAEKMVEFDAWLSFRSEFKEVLTAFRSAFGTDTSAAALTQPAVSEVPGDLDEANRVAANWKRRAESADRGRRTQAEALAIEIDGLERLAETDLGGDPKRALLASVARLRTFLTESREVPGNSGTLTQSSKSAAEEKVAFDPEHHPRNVYIECVDGYLRIMPPGDWIDFEGLVHYVPAQAEDPVAAWQRLKDSVLTVLDEESFWDQVDKSGGDNACWPWTGKHKSTGYGQVYVPVIGRLFSSHRLAYELIRGPIPKGRVLDHLCHNDAECKGGEDCPHRGCCNPAHLEVVTSAVNTRRGNSFAAINAQKTHCPKGHPFDGDNVVYRPEGGRACKACRAERDKAKYERQKKQREEEAKNGRA